MPRGPPKDTDLIKHAVLQIISSVAKTVARVERLRVECSDCQALYDARLDLEVALEKLYWLIPDRGSPWIRRKTYNGTRQWWYEVTDMHHRKVINHWMFVGANIHGIYIDKRNIDRFYKLLGEDWYTCERPASPLEAHAPPPLALPRPSEFECVGGQAATADATAVATAAQTAPFTTPQISTSKWSGAPASTWDYAATASPPPKAAPPATTLAATAVVEAQPEPEPAPPTSPMRAISAAACPAVPQASVCLLQHVFPIDEAVDALIYVHCFE